MTLWKKDTENDTVGCRTKLVEVKSARDVLSDRQKAWLMEVVSAGGRCEVCKVVEKVSERNGCEVEEELDGVAVAAIDGMVEEEDR